MTAVDNDLDMSAWTLPPDDDVGALLLDRLRAAIVRYVVLPSEHAADAVVLWVAATHAIEAWQHAPRLVIKSPEKRCGKSRLLDVIEATCHAPLVTVNATPAAIFRRIGDGVPPTLLIDEADALWGTKKSAEQNEELRALVNAGHQRGRPALRCVGPQQVPTEFATFAMAALAGIGDLPDTITDRAVNVTMRRRAPGETVANYRHRRDALPLHELREEIAEWVTSVLDRLEHAEPEMPVEDRAADTWEPLVAIADAAGGAWPARARLAAVALTTEATDEATESSLGVRLLADCRDVLALQKRAVIPSEDLVRLLRDVEESPWRVFELDARGLARRLRPYGIHSDRVRPDGDRQVRGYKVADFHDAFVRYLPKTGPDAEPDSAAGASSTVTSAHEAHPPRSKAFFDVTDDSPVTDASVTRNGSVTAETAAHLRKHVARDGVTANDAPPGANGVCTRCRTTPVVRYGPGANPLCLECRA